MFPDGLYCPPERSPTCGSLPESLRWTGPVGHPLDCQPSKDALPLGLPKREQAPFEFVVPQPAHGFAPECGMGELPFQTRL